MADPKRQAAFGTTQSGVVDLFIVVGIPECVSRHIEQKDHARVIGRGGRLRIFERQPDLSKPGRSSLYEPIIYNDSYCLSILAAMRDEVLKIPEHQQFTISVIYATAQTDGEPRLEEHLFAICLFDTIGPVPMVDIPNEQRAAASELLKQLEPKCSRLRGKGHHILRSVTTRKNSSPLMLPPRNFGVPAIDESIRTIQKHAAFEDSFEQFLRKQLGQLDPRLPRERVNGEARSWFMNSDKLIFRAGHEQHAPVHLGNDHPDHCYLRGRARLGASYRSTFHYNCVPRKGASLRSQYGSCHEQTVSTPRSTYLNISPNDFIR